MAPVAPEPRIAPGTRREIGILNMLIARVLGIAARGGPPHVFTTLARHRRLFRPWLRFAARLMPFGTLPRQDTELLILRVGHNCDCPYELAQHERIARRAGLGTDQIAAAGGPADADCWNERETLLLRATDELHDRRTLSDELWNALRVRLTERQMIELPMLVGQYEMLAMTLNTLRVAPERGDQR
jgi:AhpD family alkylhydroperoxidase